MAGFSLRVKTKSGQKVVTGLKPEDKVSVLKVKLSELTEISASELHVLIGYPPKPVDLSQSDSTLEECGIASGETLIVEEKQGVCNGEVKQTDENIIGRSHIVDQEILSQPGVLMKKIVPADNSCLFTSVGYVLNGKVDTSCAKMMREIIASAVSAEPDVYNEAILGKPNKDYCQWILKSDSWGGAIELSILSKFYGLEIAVIDSINAIINRFGEDQHYAQRVYLLFDGIHYDPIYMEPLDGGSIQTIFPSEDKQTMMKAIELAKEAKSSHQYTDIQKFTLKCNLCNKKLSGQGGAQIHAKETGHMSFKEINS
ncbi:ubiquitin thioesterase Otu1 [Prorops nasuta]|uniref:ubiquitin thioesterase Otu1 n=1 Tax=Prorops nasuta TaxID=863751 RepID=UPI0034CE981E